MRSRKTLARYLGEATAALTGAFLMAWVVTLHAATLTVCAAGCTYTNANLQAAITAAAAGDTILLQENFTYVADYTLPVKAGAGPSAWTTIRTGVTSTGALVSAANFPAANIRVCPSSVAIDTMTCSTSPGSQDMTKYAKVKALNNNSYAVSTVDTGVGAPVSYYKFQWVEFQAQTPYAGNSIIGLKNDTQPVLTGTTAGIPHHFVFDQIVLHGDPLIGQFRGMQLDASYVDITNSFIYDIKAQGEGQALWANTSTGGFTITNNYVSGGAEVWLTGGGGTAIRPQYTVGGSATTTSIPLDRVTDLYVGKQLLFLMNSRTITSNSAANPSVITTASAHGLTEGEQVVFTGTTCLPGIPDGNGGPGLGLNATGTGPWSPVQVHVLTTTTFTVSNLVYPTTSGLSCATTGGSAGSFKTRASAEIASISGNTVTLTTALPYAPASGTTADSGIVIGQSAANTFRYNWLTRPSSYRTTPIQAAPTSISAVGAITGGSLAAGTYYYRVQAQRSTSQSQTSISDAPVQVSGLVTSGTTGSVAISWTAAANAAGYIIYGRGNGAITQSWTTTGTTFTDTGAAGTGASGVAATNYWQVKNIFEFKQGINITAEYNLIENSWAAAQGGPCVLFTSTQQTGEAVSATIRNVLFQKNVVRSCAQFLQIVGMDAQGAEGARSGGLSFIDNLFYDADGAAYGYTNGIIMTGAGGGYRQHPNRGATDVIFRRNTFHSTGNSYNRALYMDYCDVTTSASLESNSPGFQWVDNIAYSGSGNATMASTLTTGAYCVDGTGVRRWNLSPNGPIGSGSSITNNVFAGDANCAGYPANVLNAYCPTVATLESNTFTNTTTIAGFAVKNTSPYITASTTSGALGADISALSPVTTVTMTGNNAAGGALAISTLSPLPNGIVNQAYSVTLTATGGTPPYTWALTSGTLPTGLSLATATGIVSGTVTSAVTNRALTFRVTDSAGTPAVVSKAFTLTMMGARQVRYNWSEGASFVRTSAPTNPNDQVKIGDRWYSLGTGLLYVATALGPPITWTIPSGGSATTDASLLTSGTLALGRLGLSGTPSTTTFLRGDNTWAAPSGGTAGAPAVQSHTLYVGPARNWVTIPASGSGGEFTAADYYQLLVDTENSTQIATFAKFTGACSTAPAAVFEIQYSTDGATWVTTGANVACSTGNKNGAYVTLPVGARAQNTFFRGYFTNSDGVADPTVIFIRVRLR